MEKIIEYLQAAIASAKERNMVEDSISWGYQEGVLITVNDAKKILKALKKLRGRGEG